VGRCGYHALRCTEQRRRTCVPKLHDGPKGIAAATDCNSYASTGANAFVDKAVLDNPAVCPDAAVKSRIWLPKAASPDYDAARLRAWQRIVTGG